jgi:hypothetical protein
LFAYTDIREVTYSFRGFHPDRLEASFYMISYTSLLRVASVAILLPVASHGTTFDWPTSPAFPAGPTNGNSVTQVYGGLGAVTLTNNGGGAWESGYPTVAIGTAANGLTSGGTTNTEGLQIFLASEPSVTAYINVVISFGYTGGVTNASFVIWDVDHSTNFTDECKNIVGVTASGALVPLTVVGSADNTVTGSGTVNATAIGTANSPNLNDTGNVTITSGTTPIQEIEFQYLDVNTTERTTQIIGISPITFTPIGSATPEVGSALGALMLCGGVVGFGALQRRKTRARAQVSC